MKHFVGYENYERMEEQADQEEIEETEEVGEFTGESSAGDDSPFGFLTRKKPERFVGSAGDDQSGSPR